MGRFPHSFRVAPLDEISNLIRQLFALRNEDVGKFAQRRAILLDSMLGPQSNWRVSILGTDLNPEFLERAREASFRTWSFRQTDVHRNTAYFMPERDSLRLQPRLRNGVRFSYLNLVKDVYPSPLTGTLGLDLIVFRNVAIYLKPEVTRAIIQRFQAALRPGGWLLSGETEVTALSLEGFTVHRFDQATLHRKAVDGSPLPSPVGPAPLPVLAAVGIASNIGVPGVPMLPDWVPLPARQPAPHRKASSG